MIGILLATYVFIAWTGAWSSHSGSESTVFLILWTLYAIIVFLNSLTSRIFLLMNLARRFGENDTTVHAIEAHHNDVEPNSVLDVLVQAADAGSAARPGARKETLDAYIKRLEKLEEIAMSYEGVERTYAIQAGREVRIMVVPEKVSDDDMVLLAHNVAKRIEQEMQYPGQIKVNVIRESRVQDVAK